MISNIVTVTAKQLEIEPTGINKILGFQGKMIIPLADIQAVKTGFDDMNKGWVWRLAGLRFFKKLTGLFMKKGVRIYFNIKGQEQPLQIELAQGKYKYLILGVDNPQSLVSQIKKRQARSN